jgi:hypothetical protein
MVRLICLIAVLFLASCAIVQNPEKEKTYDISTLSTRLTPAPEFRGAGMPIDGKATILEGSLSYRNKLNTSKVRGKNTKDLKDNYKQRFSLGNPPVEGYVSLLEKSEAILVKFTAGVDENFFFGVSFGANTKFFETGLFLFDRMGNRTYDFDGTMKEQTTYYAGSGESDISICFWDKSLCKVDSVIEKTYSSQYKEYLMTHQLGAGFFFSLFLKDFVLEYSGSFYSSAITENPDIEGLDFEDRSPVVTTQRFSVGYNIASNIAVRSGAIYTSGSFEGYYWAFFAGLSFRLFI